MIDNINWYPGHMKKTRELIEASMKLVDCVIEVIDARIPISSRNPIIDSIISRKERVIVLNKKDLANDDDTLKWESRFANRYGHAVSVDCVSGNNIKKLFDKLTHIEDAKNSEREKKRKLRIMVVGVPNVGKSTLINRLTGKKSAKTGNRPGITRGKQWLTLSNGMQLLDTPGILWHKFEDNKFGLNLAYCGSIRDEILPMDELALAFIKDIKKEYLMNLIERYLLDIEKVRKCFEDGFFEISFDRNVDSIESIEFSDLEPLEIMEAIAVKRGCILSKQRIDYERVSRIIIDEFREGKLGKITLEKFKAHE